MASSQGKVWFINNQTQKIYRLNDYGFDMENHEKHLLIKDIETGERWVIPQSDLYKTCLINGKPTELWEEMPEGWHPVKERPYPGYTNDARKEVVNNYGYNENVRRENIRRPSVRYPNRRRFDFD